MIQPCSVALLLVACLPHAGEQTPASIRVHDERTGCYESDARDYEWVEREGGYAFKQQRVTRADVDALRKLALDSEGVPKDLLTQLGFTPDSIRAHREEILEAAWPYSLRPAEGTPLVLPPELEPLLSFDALAPHVLAEAQGRNWHSTTQCDLRITLPGDPEVVVQSDGLTAWKLPWNLQAGSKRWTSSDPALSRAILRFVDPEGPNATLLDGSSYWSKDFWRDTTFWRRWVGRELEATLSKAVYCKLDGYKPAMDRFKVDAASSGLINMLPESLFLELSTLHPSTVNAARWWNPLKDNAPTSTWVEFGRVFDTATACVEKQSWLKRWKLAGPDRTLEAQVVGNVGYSAKDPGYFVSPAWRDAGFKGEPEFEILMRRKGTGCGTVWLSSTEGGAIVVSMDARPGGHWLDNESIFFHPTAPTYIRVDANGNHEKRTIQK